MFLILLLVYFIHWVPPYFIANAIPLLDWSIVPLMFHIHLNCIRNMYFENKCLNVSIDLYFYASLVCPWHWNKLSRTHTLPFPMFLCAPFKLSLGHICHVLCCFRCIQVNIHKIYGFVKFLSVSVRYRPRAFEKKTIFFSWSLVLKSSDMAKRIGCQSKGINSVASEEDRNDSNRTKVQTTNHIGPCYLNVYTWLKSMSMHTVPTLCQSAW